jgi:hypothetical protein
MRKIILMRILLLAWAGPVSLSTWRKPAKLAGAIGTSLIALVMPQGLAPTTLPLTPGANLYWTHWSLPINWELLSSMKKGWTQPKMV